MDLGVWLNLFWQDMHFRQKLEHESGQDCVEGVEGFEETPSTGLLLESDDRWGGLC